MEQEVLLQSYVFSKDKEFAPYSFSFLRFIEMFILAGLLLLAADVFFSAKTTSNHIALIIPILILGTIFYSCVRNISQAKIYNDSFQVITPRVTRKHSWPDIRIIYFPKVAPFFGGRFVPLFITTRWMVYYYQIPVPLMETEDVSQFRDDLKDHAITHSIRFI